MYEVLFITFSKKLKQIVTVRLGWRECLPWEVPLGFWPSSPVQSSQILNARAKPTHRCYSLLSSQDSLTLRLPHSACLERNQSTAGFSALLFKYPNREVTWVTWSNMRSSAPLYGWWYRWCICTLCSGHEQSLCSESIAQIQKSSEPACRLSAL